MIALAALREVTHAIALPFIFIIVLFIVIVILIWLISYWLVSGGFFVRDSPVLLELFEDTVVYAPHQNILAKERIAPMLLPFFDLFLLFILVKAHTTSVGCCYELSHLIG